MSWGLAFQYIDTGIAPFLGFVGAALFVFHARAKNYRALPFYVGSWAGFFVGFSWFYSALRAFSDWPPVVCAAAFIGFAAYGSLQMLLAATLVRLTPLDSLLYRLFAPPIAWAFTEYVFIRPIDWMLGYTQTSWLTFIQIADLGGPQLVGFMVMLVAALLVELCTVQYSVRARVALTAAAGGALFLPLAYGAYILERLESEHAAAGNADDELKVAILSMNLAPSRRYDPAVMKNNARAYGELAAQIPVNSVDLITMPESTIWQHFINLPGAERATFLSERLLNHTPPILAGALLSQNDDDSQTADDGSGTNVVVRIAPDQELTWYAKKIPFPVAEGSIFSGLSWLLGFERNAEPQLEVFEVPQQKGGAKAKVLPLICFESTASTFVAQRVARSRPDVLAEFSNHSWFASALVGRQHLAFARWRAIETRTPLIRTVNAGASSVVDGYGRISFQNSHRQEGIIIAPVRPRPTFISFYAQNAFLLSSLVPFLGGVFFAVPWSARKRQPLHPRLAIMGKGLLRVGLVSAALLYSLGTATNSDMLQAAGVASGLSPNPFVFNRFRGNDYWANDLSLELLTTAPRRVPVPITAEFFSSIDGPHHFHVALILPFAFAPVYPRDLWEPIARSFFCDGTPRTLGIIDTLLESGEQVASLKLEISSSRYSRESPQHWLFRVRCRPGEEGT